MPDVLPDKWDFKPGERVIVVEVAVGLGANVGDMATVIGEHVYIYDGSPQHSIVNVKLDSSGRFGGYWVFQFERAEGPW